jgi:hypothetical protein
VVALTLVELLELVSAILVVAVVKSGGLLWFEMNDRIEIKRQGRLRMLPCSSIFAGG